MRIIVAEGANFSHDQIPLGRAGRDHLVEQLEGVFAELIRRGLLPPANVAEAALLFTDMVIASGILSLLTFAPQGAVEDLLAPRVAFFCAGFPRLGAPERPGPVGSCRGDDGDRLAGSAVAMDRTGGGEPHRKRLSCAEPAFSPRLQRR
jgi:hypothetical protein